MATAHKNWNLMYVAGNPKMFSTVRSDASNPMKRSEALTAANRIASNGWRVWVENATTNKRIFESASEKKHALSLK